MSLIKVNGGRELAGEGSLESPQLLKCIVHTVKLKVTT